MEVLEKTGKAGRPTLAKNIAMLRKRCGWNQEELAAKAGIGISTLKDIERGLSQGQPGTRAAIAAALGCDVDDLFKAPSVAAQKSPTQSAMAQTIALMQQEIDELKSRLASDGELSEVKRELISLIRTLPDDHVVTILKPLKVDISRHLNKTQDPSRRSR